MKAIAFALALLGPLAPGFGLAQEDFAPLTAWRAYGGTDVPSSWRMTGNDISHSPGGGDLISVERFGDFELAFDWRIAPGGNSGVFYRVDEAAGIAHASGPEYQILDNQGHPDGQNPLTSAASAFALYAPAEDVTRPAGEWNSARILVDGTHVEHWLNGTKVLEFELGSPDWEARVADSKFADLPAYGKASEGHISLQDHGSAVDYRNFRVRALPDR